MDKPSKETVVKTTVRAAAVGGGAVVAGPVGAVAAYGAAEMAIRAVDTQRERRRDAQGDDHGDE